MKKANIDELKSWVEIVIGLLLSALAYRMMLIPNEVAPGGFTGVGQICNALFGWPVGTVAMVMNVPLFALSLRSIGWRFGMKSLAASVALSLLIDYLPVDAITDDKLMAALFGGLLSGVGFGLILRGGATTGGTDMLGVLIHRFVSAFRVSTAVFLVDGLVVLASGVVFDITAAMRALVAAFVMSRVMDVVLEGGNMAKAYFIISDRAQPIAHRLMEELDRGVTGLYARGMYTETDKQVLLCVIKTREITRLRAIIAEQDPRAFMIATDVREAWGEGFRPHKA